VLGDAALDSDFFASPEVSTHAAKTVRNEIITVNPALVRLGILTTIGNLYPSLTSSIYLLGECAHQRKLGISNQA
jgi:hypothetical protein